MTTSTPTVPNHHADHPGFSGVTGALVGATMTIARGGVARLAAKLTDVGPADRVVDVGCGPGTAVREAARRGATVTGVDPAPVMLSLARRFTRDGSGITWLEGAAEDLPVDDGAATVLWSIASVHHWPDLDAGLAEAFRALAPGGRLLAMERRTRPGARGLASHGWTDAQAEAFVGWCSTAGFADPVVQVRGRGRQIAVTATRPEEAGPSA